MEWIVVKTGATQFDLLHAMGLGLVIATACRIPVRLEDKGVVYTLECSLSDLPAIPLEVLIDQTLELPSAEEVGKVTVRSDQVSTAIANLDGVLALLFTTPGVRAVSVQDAISKTRTRTQPGSRQAIASNATELIIEDCISKASKAVKKWKKSIEPKANKPQVLLLDLLEDYQNSPPGIPAFKKKSGAKDFTVTMTIESSYSYSTRQPLSDGLVGQKDSLAASGTRYAGLLAALGAAKFLRASRLANDLVVLFVPAIEKLKIELDSSLPILLNTDYNPAQAVVVQGLASLSSKEEWVGLSYQILQTQGVQQSISLARGYFDLFWLRLLEDKVGSNLLHYWQVILKTSREKIYFEIDDLLDVLLTCQVSCWLAHLLEIARRSCSSQTNLPSYSFNEAKEIIAAMTDGKRSPLWQIMEREAGTRRFGFSLRLLGRYNHSIYRDLLEILETVQTIDQLLRFVAQAVQAAVVANAKTQFMIVPTDQDLKLLMRDAEEYTPKTVASLLMALAPLRFDSVADKPTENVSAKQQPDNEIFALTRVEAEPTVEIHAEITS
jgi:hypothetical protein